MDAAFSIHQELWHDCWLAATAAARSRKRQVDLDVRKRVERLLQDYGPESGKPLTLRVYGTMIKGFCVINNERARCLFADCERMVLMFSQQCSWDESRAAKLPAAKKQRVDALTLDLDLAKVQESEAFDWTQAPLEEGALLQLQAAPEEQLALALSVPQAPSLLEQAALLDESFPAADAPPSALPGLEAAGVAKSLAPAPGDADAGALEMTDMAPEMPEQAVLPFEELLAHAVQVAEPPLKQRRKSRLAAKLPPPGTLLGYDAEPVLSQEDAQEWQLNVDSITCRPRYPEDHVAMLPEQAIAVEHLGPLRVLMDPSPELLRAAVVAKADGGCSALALISRAPRRPAEDGAVAVEEVLPEVQALLASEGVQPEMLSGVFAPPPEGPEHGAATGSALLLAASRRDPFHPYSPEVPLQAASGASEELAGLLDNQPSPGAESEDHEEAAGQCGPYDHQTAKVGAVLRHFIERGSSEAGNRGVTLDDIIPPGTTDKATAAKTFAAVLVLATAGDLRVMQPMAYGPIAMSIS